MTKEEQRKMLEAMMAGKPVTKIGAKPMDDSLSASFKAKAAPKKRVKRNWAAQRRYDEIHGTDNGYDPQIEAWNDFHRNEMGG